MAVHHDGCVPNSASPSLGLITEVSFTGTGTRSQWRERLGLLRQDADVLDSPTETEPLHPLFGQPAPGSGRRRDTHLPRYFPGHPIFPLRNLYNLACPYLTSTFAEDHCPIKSPHMFGGT